MRLALLLALALAGCARSDVLDPRPTDAGPGPAPDAGPPDAGSCDPAGWRAAAPAPFAADHAQAVTLLDGRVLLVGNDVGATALFDPTTHAWTPTGPTNLPHSDFTATLLADGRVLLVGGRDPRAELYSPAGGLFRLAGALPGVGGRTRAAAVRLDDGRVLLAGGLDTGLGTLSEVAAYAASADLWTALAPLPEPRELLTLTKLADGSVLAAGGDRLAHDGPIPGANAWRYDPRADRWASVGPLVHPRSGHTATLLADGRVLLAGGADASGTALRSTELFDPATNAFAEGPLLQHARLSHVAQRLPDGPVLLAGGLQAGGASDAPPGEELFDPASGTITAVRRLIEPRAFPASALLGHQVLLSTGQPVAGSGGPLSSSELFGCP